MVGKGVELIVHDDPLDGMAPYERLLGDALRGDGSLFTRDDCVEAAWRVVDPVLGNVTPPVEYQPNTWGPSTAEKIIADGGHWHDRAPETVSR